MTTVLPLAVWPFPVPPVVVEALKVAKARLCERDGVEFQLQLSPAVPASPTRVLSFKGPLPFAADTAMLRNWEDPDELMYWLEWVLNPAQPVEAGFTVLQWIQMHFPGATEIPYEMKVDRVYDSLPF